MNLEALEQAFLAVCPDVAGKRYLLFLGRLHPKKGCDLLLDAYAKTLPRDLDLVMAGPDQAGWESELRAQASRSGHRGQGALDGSTPW